MIPRPYLLALVPAALLAPAAAAQQHPAAEARPDDIVVIGTGLPLPPGTPAYGSVTIDRERLLGEASGRVENVLKDVAGFQQFRRSDSRSANPSAQGVTLRALGGNASSRALVLLDGVPIADPFFGYIPFTTLAAERLGGVRITRGGGSGPFGAGAVAGTVELVSAARRDLPLVAGEALVGSDAAVALSGAVSPSLGTGFVTLSGRFEHGDGFFTTPPEQRVAATARARYRAASGELRAVVPLGAGEVQVRTVLFDDHRTLRFRGADSASSGQDASVRLLLRGRWQVDALAYVQARTFANKVISATNFRLTLDQRDTPSTGLGGKIELRPPVGADHVLRFGVDARIAEGALAEEAYSAVTGQVTTRRRAGGRSSTTGLFVEHDWTLGRLVLTGGARIDRWQISGGFFEEANAEGVPTSSQRFAARDGTEATARAGMLFRASDALSLRAAGYTGFRLPTLNELYRPFVVFPITTQANAALAPERLRGGEVGVDLQTGGAGIGLTAFHSRLHGAIANATIGPNLRQRRNVEAIVARGVEATLAARRGAVSLDASYAFSAARVSAAGALDGLTPAQSPRHSVSATLGWAPSRGPALGVTLRYVGPQFEDDLESDVLPAAVTLDATARLPLTRRLALVGRVENLFDEKVVTRNAAGSIDYGTPRLFWVGVRLR